MNENLEIIVSRYNENIDWLLPIADKCIIYNKGNLVPEETRNKFKTIIETNNIGREAQSYLMYIVSNYESFFNNKEKILIFTQANINDHVPLLFKNKELEYLSYLAENAHKNDISDNCEAYDVGISSVSENLKFADKYDISDSGYKFGEWFRKFINSDYKVLNKDTIKWYIAAIFSIKSKCILNNPKNSYNNLLLECSKGRNTEQAHYMERSWYVLFNGKKENYLER